MSYHIVNARIVNEGRVTRGDLSVARGRILGVNAPAPPGAEVIDAAGGYLLPGIIDDQVHFREPGFEHKATIATESRDARLHVLHMTTARELDVFESGDLADKRITAETCVHHLFFNDTAYAAKGAEISCNPAIKSAADQQALWAAVNNDRIDVIATDHTPHTAEEKARLYAEAPAGLPLVQHALLTLFEHVRAGTFSVETVVDKTAHAPARLFGITERGFIREGYWADLVLVDPATPTSDGPIFSKCGWSPFSDIMFGSRVRMTWVNGALRYRDGELQTGAGGRALEFERA